MSVQINSFAFSGNYKIIDLIIDESTPQELNLMRLARKDGAKLVSSNFAPKEISIKGLIMGTSVSDLETNIDTFKQNTMITEADLDLSYAGGYRRFTVDCSQCIVTRQNFNVTYAPFELKYIASNPPFAEEIDAIAGNPVMNSVFSADMMTGGIYTADVEIGGTAKPKPLFNIFVDTSGNLNMLTVKNITCNTQMDLTTVWANGDRVDINTDEETVTINDNAVEYAGIFPEFNVGSNDLEFYGDATGSLETENTTSDVNAIFSDDLIICQSFQVSSATNYNKVVILVKRDSGVTGDLTVRIETNSGSQPSGTLVHANATKTLPASAIGTNYSWVVFDFNDFALSASTTYWIVVSTNEVSATGYNYYWAVQNTNVYANGSYGYFSGGVWYPFVTYDATFKVHKSTVPTWELSTRITYQRRYL